MILEVLANIGVSDFGFNAGGFEDIWVSDAGELEKLGRLHASGTDDDFAVCRNEVFIPAMEKPDALGNPLSL